jgi:hypothetical protein
MIVLALGAAALVPGLHGCRVGTPSNRPIEACMNACTARAARQCSEADCARGCELILDRLVEKEMDNVIACMARTPRRCTDVVWADCAAHVGVHADGGPPAPLPPVEEE